MRLASDVRGYTLIELIVTVLIIGILTAVGVPQYLKTVETGKADDAVAVVNMIATTNKMYALDHNNQYVTGTFTASCAASACPSTPDSNPCDLVWCKYLADQDWATKPYTYSTADAVSGPTKMASAQRNGGSTPYSTWAYTVAPSGLITASGTNAPPPTY